MKQTWLFSENLSKTADNNSFYLWKYVVNLKDPQVEAFFIIDDNSKLRNLCSHESKYIVERNSKRHIELYESADIYFVTLSYRDVQPDKNLFKFNQKYHTKKPLVYLQHGILGIKRIGYDASYAENGLVKFCIYNLEMERLLVEINGFKPYQIFNGIALPRWRMLAQKFFNQKYTNRTILWFLTWREYLSDADLLSGFINEINLILSDSDLQNFLKENNYTLKVLCHQFLGDKLSQIDVDNNIEICSAINVNVMDELASAKLLITDYSSVGFDFTLLNKPVILYAPDFKEYRKEREFYCSDEEYSKHAIFEKDQLLATLKKNNWQVNSFFSKRLQKINLNKLANGVYLQKFYEYYKNQLANQIIFLGYDFSGVGGTVTATLALAEGLRERGFFVRFVTLKRQKTTVDVKGIPVETYFGKAVASKLDQFKNRLGLKFFASKWLKSDPAFDNISILASEKLLNELKRGAYKYVISTRESLHIPLAKIAEVRKDIIPIYFFHCSAKVVDSLFPGILKTLADKELNKVLFVTKTNKELLRIKGIYRYRDSLILGNSLDSSRMLDSIQVENNFQPLTSNKIKCATLFRISKDRIDIINNILSFGMFMKKNRINNIIINVYGSGNALDQFKNDIEAKGLNGYVKYQFNARVIPKVMAANDCVIDFAETQSFGMPYIEAILNGKIPFCKCNEGSMDVLSKHPELFYNNNMELAEKIKGVRLLSNNYKRILYDEINGRYGREVVVNRLVNFISE